jgi:hypothetical protein
VQASDNAGALEGLRLAVLCTEVHETGPDSRAVNSISAGPSHTRPRRQEWTTHISFSERPMSFRPQAARLFASANIRLSVG